MTTPSDQYTPDGDGLREVLEEAERIALNDRAFVTLGVAPTNPRPATDIFGPVRRMT
ncbi:MAG: hypothetical protein ACQEXQ_17275 [Bacillota bacterium]